MESAGIRWRDGVVGVDNGVPVVGSNKIRPLLISNRTVIRSYNCKLQLILNKTTTFRGAPKS